VKKPYDAALRLLMNRRVDAVVAENDAGAVLSDGLAYDRCTVGIVTDLTLDDSLQHHDVRETAQLFKVLRTQVDVVLADGAAVLNAEDAQVADMAELCDGEVIFYSRSSEAAALVAHRHGGGRAVVAREGKALLLSDQGEQLGANIDPLLQRFADAGQSCEAPAVLAAVAAAWALGISPELISAGLDNFVPSL
jgi:cyanophycin synthetase